MRVAFVVPLVLLLAMSSPAHAALNGSIPYSGVIRYASPTAATNVTFLSGAMTAQATDVHGVYGFFNTTGAHIDGLTRVCWAVDGCATSPEGRLTIVVQPGGDFGMRLPAPSSANVSATHALALFADFNSQRSLNTLGLGRELVAPVENGSVSFRGVRAIPQNAGYPDESNSGIVVGVGPVTHILAKNGAVLVHSVDGQDGTLLFQGRPTIPTFASSLISIPFEQSSTAHFTGATTAAAYRGIDAKHVSDLTAHFQGAAGSSPTPSNFTFGDLKPIAAGVLNGALVEMPTNSKTGGIGLLRELVLVRFSTMDATAGPSQVALKGNGVLQVSNGHVAGASPLVGFALLQAPWWGFALWGLAIIGFIVVAIVKPAKDHPVWDRFNWVGWVAGPLVLIVVALLWDHEVKTVWGVSLFSGGLSGTAIGIVAALEILPAIALMLAIVSPLRLIFRFGLRLAGQGKFMRLSRPLSLLLGYFLCAGLMRTYLDFALRQVLAAG